MGKEIQMTPGNTESVENTETVDTVEETVVEEYKFLQTEDLTGLSDEELEAKVEELNKSVEEHAEFMKNKLYVVNLESQSNLSKLKKWLEKEVKWDHKTVPTLVAVYDGLKKAIQIGVDEDGNAHFSPVVVSHIYQYLLTFQGQGYIDAKRYLTLLTQVGGPISEAMKELADDQQHFRNVHTDLATIDQVMEARKQGIEINTDKAEDAELSIDGEQSEMTSKEVVEGTNTVSEDNTETEG